MRRNLHGEWMGSSGVDQSRRPAAFAYLSTLLAPHALPHAVLVTRSTDQRRSSTNQGGARAAEMIKLFAFDCCRCRARADRSKCWRGSHSRLSSCIVHGVALLMVCRAGAAVSRVLTFSVCWVTLPSIMRDQRPLTSATDPRGARVLRERRVDAVLGPGKGCVYTLKNHTL